MEAKEERDRGGDGQIEEAAATDGWPGTRRDRETTPGEGARAAGASAGSQRRPGRAGASHSRPRSGPRKLRRAAGKGWRQGFRCAVAGGRPGTRRRYAEAATGVGQLD